jgi:epoxyqueuosine reductase
MDSAGKTALTKLIRDSSKELGFDLCGIASSRILSEHGQYLKKWCASGMHGDMDYLCRDIEKRTNPEYLVAGAKSVIVTGLGYYTPEKQAGKGEAILSRYVFGNDYHDVIKVKLNKILDRIKSVEPHIKGRAFVDSAPLLEKAWAREAGLGWQGRNTIIINKTTGSFFFIGVILLDAELEYDEPFEADHCGECRLCVNACPTGAINENRTIDARKCIAYLTIESRGPITDELALKMEGRIFGCDRCQEVCPWNRDIKPHETHEFEITGELASMTREDWIGLTKDRFTTLFRKSAVKRGKYERLMRNVRAALGE